MFLFKISNAILTTGLIDLPKVKVKCCIPFCSKFQLLSKSKGDLDLAYARREVRTV